MVLISKGIFILGIVMAVGFLYLLLKDIKQMEKYDREIEKNKKDYYRKSLLK